MRIRHRLMWFVNLTSRITWNHITRVIGLVLLTYEVLVEKGDRPSLMIVIGSMILGVEAFSRDRRKFKE